MKQDKMIESLIVVTVILISGSISMSFPVNWEAATTEEQEDSQREPAELISIVTY